MTKWQIIAPDHGSNEGQYWLSRTFDRLAEAVLEAAWLQARSQLFGYDDHFTVVEVEA